MQEYFLIAIVLSIILLALWRWDEHARREERHRRHLENSQRQGPAAAP